MATTSDEPDSLARLGALQRGLQELGWIGGRNLQIEVRWSGGDATRLAKDAADLVTGGSDVIIAGVGPTPAVLHQATRTVPVVMPQVVDPVGAGFVQSLSRPGGNMTGFTQFEYSLSGKWFELLREIAPQVSRVGVVRDFLAGPVSVGQWAVIQAFASPRGVELSPINIRVAADIERDLTAFARVPNSGVIVVVGTIAHLQRDLLVSLAARHRLPAIYPYRFFADAGGMLSYGPNLNDQWRRAANYVDRILKGERPADLPVQAPTKYELVVNLKTTKALGVEVPPALLATADEVIE